MARPAALILLFTVIACSSGPEHGTASTAMDTIIEAGNTDDSGTEAVPDTPMVWISSARALQGLVHGWDEHLWEPELPRKLGGGDITYVGVDADTGSFKCVFMEHRNSYLVACLKFKDRTGSSYWSAAAYDSSWTVRGNLVVETWRSGSRPDAVLLVGSVRYGHGDPLDYLIRLFDPNDSLACHPDGVEASKAVGYKVCDDGSIRCCPIPSRYLLRPVEIKFAMDSTCRDC